MVFAQGKLLISGEYLVLDGAKAIAFPLKYGQSLKCSETSDAAVLHWQSFEEEELWLDLKLNKKTLEIVEVSDIERAGGVIKIIKEAQLLNKNAPALPDHMEVRSNFPFISGFGSSSTLIALMAHFFKVDVFQLSDATFGGSGYDVACAFHEGPLLYQNKKTEKVIQAVDLSDDITQYMFFVHSGQKMNSRNAIAHYRSQNEEVIASAVQEINTLSEQLLKASTFEELNNFGMASEKLLQGILKQASWNDVFPDCPFTLKALGAWGGDYFMAIAHNKEEVKNYFKKKNLNQILCYQELI